MSIYIGNKQIAGNGGGIVFADDSEFDSFTGRLAMSTDPSTGKLYLSQTLEISDNSDPGNIPNESRISFNDAGNLGSMLRFSNTYNIALNPCYYENFKWYSFSQYGIHLSNDPDISYTNGAIDLLIPADFHAPTQQNTASANAISGKLIGNRTYNITTTIIGTAQSITINDEFLSGETVVIYANFEKTGKLSFTATNITIKYALNYQDVLSEISQASGTIGVCFALHKISDSIVLINAQIYQ